MNSSVPVDAEVLLLHCSESIWTYFWQALIARGAQVNTRNNENKKAIHWADENGFFDIAHALWEAGDQLTSQATNQLSCFTDELCRDFTFSYPHTCGWISTLTVDSCSWLYLRCSILICNPRKEIHELTCQHSETWGGREGTQIVCTADYTADKHGDSYCWWYWHCVMTENMDGTSAVRSTVYDLAPGCFFADWVLQYIFFLIMSNDEEKAWTAH